MGHRRVKNWRVINCLKMSNVNVIMDICPRQFNEQLEVVLREENNQSICARTSPSAFNVTGVSPWWPWTLVQELSIH